MFRNISKTLFSDILVNFRIALYLVKTVCTVLSFFFLCHFSFLLYQFSSQVEIYFFKVLLPYGLSPKAETVLWLNYLIGLGVGQ